MCKYIKIVSVRDKVFARIDLAVTVTVLAKLLLFLNQYKISRRLVYDMTLFEKTAQATIFTPLRAFLGISASPEKRAPTFFESLQPI